MSSHYKLPDPETIHHHGEQCGTAGEFVRDIVSESIRKVREVYEDAAMIGHACSERLNALDVETGPVIEQYAYTLREVTAARETQKSLDVLIRKLEQALKDERNRYAEIQEQIDSTDENEKKSALLNEQKNLLMDLQKKFRIVFCQRSLIQIVKGYICPAGVLHHLHEHRCLADLPWPGNKYYRIFITCRLDNSFQTSV